MQAIQLKDKQRIIRGKWDIITRLKNYKQNELEEFFFAILGEF